MFLVIFFVQLSSEVYVDVSDSIHSVFRDILRLCFSFLCNYVFSCQFPSEEQCSEVTLRILLLFSNSFVIRVYLSSGHSILCFVCVFLNFFWYLLS